MKRDWKRIQKRHLEEELLMNTIKMIATKQSLPPSYHDHELSGRWRRHRECHIAPDWLLIYTIDGQDLILEATGSHADLFGLWVSTASETDAFVLKTSMSSVNNEHISKCC